MLKLQSARWWFDSTLPRQTLGVSYNGTLYLPLKQKDVGSTPTAPTMQLVEEPRPPFKGHTNGEATRNIVADATPCGRTR